MSFIETGYLDYEELSTYKKLPSLERYAKGPVAIAECIQEIPCNPCEAACMTGSINIGTPITNLPKINYNTCTGCGLCIAQCAGMAIFVIDKSYSETNATVSFPYEYSPLPTVGSIVDATDRKGEIICKGEIKKIISPKSFDHTAVITIEIPIDKANIVRGIKRGK